MQDMSDRARCVRQKLQKNARYVRQSKICPTDITKNRMICPTELYLSDKNDNKTQDMSDRARYVRQKM